MPYRSILGLLLALQLGWSPLPATAEETLRVSALTTIDRDFMAEQRRRINDLASFNFGRQLRGDKANDLDILQLLLDRRLVHAEQTLELQAMGVVMGDLLAEELGMHWVVYEDRLGRSRALQLGRSEHYLFPITMISRRAEVGAEVNVRAIYDRAVALIEPYRVPLPFR